MVEAPVAILELLLPEGLLLGKNGDTFERNVAVAGVGTDRHLVGTIGGIGIQTVAGDILIRAPLKLSVEDMGRIGHTRVRTEDAIIASRRVSVIHVEIISTLRSTFNAFKGELVLWADLTLRTFNAFAKGSQATAL